MSADAVLAEFKDVDQGEAFASSADACEVRFVAGQVKGATVRETSGVGVRAIKGGKLGFSGTRDTSQAARLQLRQNVLDSLEVGDPSQLVFPPPAEAAPVPGLFDEATGALGVPQLGEIGAKVFGALRARHPDVVFEGKVRRSKGQHSLANSAGAGFEERYTGFSISVEANRTRDEDVLLDFVYAGAPAVDGVDPEAVVERLSQRLRWAERTVEFRPGKVPVVFTPEGSLLLWRPLLQALNGTTVMLGTSPLRERLGEQVLDPRVSLVDDGRLPGALGSAAYDDEGTPRQRTPLIEGGVLRGFVHDLDTAQRTGQQPTGNAQRGGALGQPSPGYTNVLVSGGETPQAELLAGIDYGLLVHSVIGMGQGNTLPGNFSNPVDVAFLIEHGQVVGRVKDVSLAGNVYDVLGAKHLLGLSKEVEPVYGTYRLPWVFVKDLNVVGKSAK
ncbi:MAG: TldD/PmbA family protein [Planctomycetes bacterium]|nr:TldD/PmbA family protein [Planctomycetota bacterium]